MHNYYMRISLLKEYLSLVLQEKQEAEELEQEASGAGAIAGYTAPLGFKPITRKKSKKQSHTK